MFGSLEPLEKQPKFAALEQFGADPRPDKLLLHTGVYRDAQGQCLVTPCVKTAEARILASETTKDYLDIVGCPVFGQTLRELVLGPDHAALARAATLQTPGGTAALRLAAEMIRTRFGGARMWVSDRTWGNHRQIFSAAGLEMCDYPYADLQTWTLDVPAMCAALEAGARPGDAVLLQACCHNPTGLDPDLAGWDRIASTVARAGLLPLVDIAFFGMGRGLEADLAGVAALAASDTDLLVAVSLSKAFSLYRERVGGLIAVGATADARDRAVGHLRRVARASYSTPPAHGGAIVSTILSDPALRAAWVADLDGKLARIRRMRTLLPARLAAAGVPGDFSHIPRQLGVFTPLGLLPEQVDALRDRFGIYMPGSGWLNVAALPETQLDRFCAAVAAVVGGQ